jgi:inner membrane protein
MLFRTHLAFCILFILLLILFVDGKVLFFILAILGVIVPDLDTKNSRFGRKIFFRPFQFFLNHRGFVHSIFFGLLFALILSIFYPVFGLGFFVGFSSHILSDSFTVEGIAAFWPFKKRISGFIKTGSYSESIIFYSLVFVDTLIFIFLIQFLQFF